MPNVQVQLDYSQLHKNSIIKEQYVVTVTSQFEVLQWMEKQYPGKSLGPYLLHQQKKIPMKEKQAKSKWNTEGIMELMQERQKMTKGSPEHSAWDKRTKKKCRERKE